MGVTWLACHFPPLLLLGLHVGEEAAPHPGARPCGPAVCGHMIRCLVTSSAGRAYLPQNKTLHEK